MIFFFNLADFSYLKEEKKNEGCWTWSEQVKNGPFLKRMQMVSNIFQ
jgi:hypothetical protein